jgi:hypothetical protein
MRSQTDKGAAAARMAALARMPAGEHQFCIYWRRRFKSYETSAQLLAALSRLKRRANPLTRRTTRHQRREAA